MTVVLNDAGVATPDRVDEHMAEADPAVSSAVVDKMDESESVPKTPAPVNGIITATPMQECGVARKEVEGMLLYLAENAIGVGIRGVLV